jgi:ubiquitin carboxyl-terminal hydrolase 4/11/15
MSNPDAVKTKAAYLLMYRRRTTRPIGAKSRELVESAMQSRNVSATTSEAGLPSPSQAVSLNPSPFGSTENLLSVHMHSNSRSTTAFNDADGEDELYGPSTYTQSTYPSERFSGVFGRRYSNGEPSDTEAEVGSPPRSGRTSPVGMMGADSPFDEWNDDTFELVTRADDNGAQEEEAVDVNLDDAASATGMADEMDKID